MAVPLRYYLAFSGLGMIVRIPFGNELPRLTVTMDDVLFFRHSSGS